MNEFGTEKDIDFNDTYLHIKDDIDEVINLYSNSKVEDINKLVEELENFKERVLNIKKKGNVTGEIFTELAELYEKLVAYPRASMFNKKKIPPVLGRSKNAA